MNNQHREKYEQLMTAFRAASDPLEAIIISLIHNEVVYMIKDYEEEITKLKYKITCLEKELVFKDVE